jgi:hypothetical protein
MIPLTEPSTETADSPVRLVLRISYIGLILFTIGYYIRPEDLFDGGRYFPLALIGGVLAIGSYIFYITTGGSIKRTREVRIILALLGWFILSIPFAYWKGGSFQIVKDNVSKILLLTIVIMSVVTTISKLRNLLLIQTLAVALMGWIAHTNFDETNRAVGNSSAFGNSNDLAVILCVSIPLLFFFATDARSTIKKIFFAAAMLLVLYTITITYSRTGFLAMIVVFLSLTWHFGIKPGHYLGVLSVASILLVGFLIFMPSGYEKLIASIYNNDVDATDTVRQDASASSEERRILLNRAIELTLTHPLLGVGPNGFEQMSGRWRVEHNTYLQFSTEAGLPALILFLVLVYRTFSNLKDTESIAVPGSEIWCLVGALRASFWAFLVGGLFTNFAYVFFPYFLIGFAAALNQIATNDLSRGTDSEMAPA